MARYTGTYQYAYGDRQALLSAPSLTSEFYRQFQTTKYFVQIHDTLDKIAFDFYDGHGELWWIIAQANDFFLPTDLNPGTIINVPLDYSSIIQTVLNINNG